MIEESDLGARSQGTLDETLGFEFLETGEELARGRFTVADRVRQPMGIVHGGVYAAMAETLASMATWLHVRADGNIAVGQSNNTSFLRPVSDGSVHAEARRRHRGRTSWVWEVDFTDDHGRLCAISRVTMAVRPEPTQTRSGS
ncbi:MAG: PaaI family thioesterase [Thermoleophilaceae bacterium]